MRACVYVPSIGSRFIIKNDTCEKYNLCIEVYNQAVSVAAQPFADAHTGLRSALCDLGSAMRAWRELLRVREPSCMRLNDALSPDAHITRRPLPVYGEPASILISVNYK